AGRRPTTSHRDRPTEYARTAMSPPLLPLPESAAAIVEPAPQATGPGPSPLAVLFTHQRTVGAFELRPQRRGRVATAIGVQKVLPCAVIANRTAHEHAHPVGQTFRIFGQMGCQQHRPLLTDPGDLLAHSQPGRGSQPYGRRSEER